MTIYLPIAQMSADIFALLMLGGMTGVLSGMFGVGGGFLMTPLLIFSGVPPAVAVASVANQIIASSVSGFYNHWRKGNVDFRMGILLLVGGLVGSSAGVWLFSLLKGMGQIDLVISIGYVLFLTLIGGTMALESGHTIHKRKRSKRLSKAASATAQTIAVPELTIDAQAAQEPETLAPTPSRRSMRERLPLQVHFPRSNLHMSALLPFGLSAMIGVLVSILGIGGGFFMIPAMLYLLRMPASVVVGTSLFQVIFVTANVTFLHAVTTQSVDIILAGLMLIGSSVGAQVGTRMGLKLREEYLRALLAGIVLLVALRLGINLVATPDNLYTLTLSQAAL